jgi:Tfp pilus assembly protein PilN
MRLPTKKRTQVNLLPKDPFERSVLGIVLSWALSFAKWAVIVTQLIVIGVFLFRFGYDRQLTDLKKEIALQTGVIRSYTEIERDYTLLSKRVAHIKSVEQDYERMQRAVDELESNTPLDMWYENMTVTPKTVAIVANAGSLTGFSQFVRSISSISGFESVAINSLQDGAKSGARLQFDMGITLGDSKNDQAR